MRDRDHIGNEALAAELDRICESSAFRHSLRHQQFLRHLVGSKTAGKLSALREIALAMDFFHRPASVYDPKCDPVVRVEAGRLRQRLDRYYQGEGAAAALEIMLPRGSYVPVLRVRAATAVEIGAQPSVAVLPLPPRSGAEIDVRSAAGFADEIARTLSRLPSVRVFAPDSPTAAFAAGARAEARERHQVEWIVRGRWLSDSPRTLSIEAIGTSAGEVEFALSIDTAAGDTLAIHERIRTGMLHHFVPLLAARGGDDPPVAAGARPSAPTRDVAAFDLYQRARHMLRQRQQPLLAKAIENLEAAVRADPGFGSAWAELAGAYVRQRQLVFDVAQRDPGRARQAAERAIELDPDAGRAWAILAGLAYVADFDWPRAARLFERALAATPRDAAVRCAYATFLMYSGRFEDSLREYDVLQALDPLDPLIRCQKGALYFYWRQFDRAETLLAQALEMNPQDVYARLLLADVYAQAGSVEASLAASRELVAIAPDYANAYVYEARALELLGRGEEAAAVVGAARLRFGEAAITEYEEAMLWVARGDAASAFACLEGHALRRANGAHCLVVDPTFAVLHDDARWRAMLERVGLPDFARSA